MDHIKYIEAQIADRAKRIAELERELIERCAELRAYEDMKARLAGDSAPTRKGSRVAVDHDASVPTRRKLGQLSRILITTAVRAYPGTVNMDDGVRAAAEETGENIPRNNVRSSFWSNTKAGFLERVEEGSFRATAAGAEMIGERLGPIDDPTNGVNAAHQAEGEAERSVTNEDTAERRDLLSHAGGSQL